MTSTQAALKIQNGLNKLSSSDYPNVELWKMEEAVNSAVLLICRRKLSTKEATTSLVDDLQTLLKSEKLSGDNKEVYFLSKKLPSDYFAYSKNTPICKKGYCKNVRLVSDLVEDANVDELLSDYNSSPSFDFEQTFHTINGNKIKQYHNDDFEVKELELSYYRRPQYITFPNTPQVNGGIGKDMTWEFNDGMCELIIEEATGILAGNIESINRYQIAQNNKQLNK